VTLALVETSATFSPCGGYRYDLVRRWGHGPSVCWVMLNPSTATETTNDPTIRRCIDFSKRWGAGGLVVVNLYALRSTDPRGLLGGPEPTNATNAETIRRHIAAAGVVVAAWGATWDTLGLPRCHVEMWAADFGKEVWCLGKTKGGHPRHPLYVPRAKALEPFVAEHPDDGRCSGLSAHWCAVHGRCSCPLRFHGAMDDPGCRLHRPTAPEAPSCAG
jgi:hypothetical protein